MYNEYVLLKLIWISSLLFNFILKCFDSSIKKIDREIDRIIDVDRKRDIFR